MPTAEEWNKDNDLARRILPPAAPNKIVNLSSIGGGGSGGGVGGVGVGCKERLTHADKMQRYERTTAYMQTRGAANYLPATFPEIHSGDGTHMFMQM